jgi:glycosyltransferase involved in cell wall biosynthesis
MGLIRALDYSFVKVVHIQRRPVPTQFSVEGYFERVRECLRSTIQVRQYVVPCFSRGLFGRVRNCLAARWNQADVNHVTGDIHYVACLLPRRKTVLTVLDCQILTRLTGWRRALVKLLWYTLPIRCVSRITVISEETKRQLLKEVRFPAERVHVIPVSVAERFQPSPKAFDYQNPRILQVGTKANKNVVRLVQALQGIPCTLEIVGPIDEPLSRLLHETGVQYRAYGRLTDEELVQRYCEADVISFVSTYEGFGMPIVEAQCVERVCVTSNCSSMPEVAGEGACLVDPLDVASIRAGFQRVIADEEYRTALIAAGRVNRLRFNAQKIADDFLKVYQLVYEESRGNSV